MYGFYVRRWLVVGGLDGEGYMDPAVARALVWIFRLVIDCVKKEKANNHVVGVVFRDARRAMGGRTMGWSVGCLERYIGPFYVVLWSGSNECGGYVHALLYWGW
jgi:hypothetical protein